MVTPSCKHLSFTEVVLDGYLMFNADSALSTAQNEKVKETLRTFALLSSLSREVRDISLSLGTFLPGKCCLSQRES